MAKSVEGADDAPLLYDVVLRELAEDVLRFDPLAGVRAPSAELRQRSRLQAGAVVYWGRAAAAHGRSDLAAEALALAAQVHDLAWRGHLVATLGEWFLPAQAGELAAQRSTLEALLSAVRALPNSAACWTAKIGSLLRIAERCSPPMGDLRQAALDSALRVARCDGSGQLLAQVARAVGEQRGAALFAAMVDTVLQQLTDALGLVDLDQIETLRRHARAACGEGPASGADVGAHVAAVFTEGVIQPLAAEWSALDALVQAGLEPDGLTAADRPAWEALQRLLAMPPAHGVGERDLRVGIEWGHFQFLYPEDVDAIRSLFASSWMLHSPMRPWFLSDMVDSWLQERRAARQAIEVRLRQVCAVFAAPATSAASPAAGGVGATAAKRDDVGDPDPADLELSALAGEALQNEIALSPAQLGAAIVQRVVERTGARDAAVLQWCADPAHVVEAARASLPGPGDADAAADEWQRLVSQSTLPPPESDGIVRVFWSGGFDSTFMVCRQVLAGRRPVQPIYIEDPAMDDVAGSDFHRRSFAQEKQAMAAVRSELQQRFPDAAQRLRPLEIIGPLRLDRAVVRSMVGLSQSGFGRPVRQYAALAQVCRQLRRPVGVGVERSYHSAMYHLLRDVLVLDPDGGRRIAPDPDPIDLAVFADFRFPVIDLTKHQMLDVAEAEGFADLLRLTWSCWFPTDGVPCGRCAMCAERIV